MSRWDWDERQPRAPKKPPPERGIRLKKAGTTWWGKRWIEALEQVLGGDAGRLARGKSYARAGRAHDLGVVAGTVTAQVTGTRATPYDVRITLTQLSDPIWQSALTRLAEEAQFAAELLAGMMPRRIDEVFLAVGASLFPERREDIETSCSCPDWGDPCKHVAATHYLLGEAFDADPFLLFELRGRTRAHVLSGLRAARGGETRLPSGSVAAAEPSELATPRVRLGALAPDEYDRARTPLPSLEFSFEAPEVHAALLRQLGLPGAWRGEETPVELLAPLVARAAEAARRIALSEELPAEELPAEELLAEELLAEELLAAAPLERPTPDRAPAADRAGKGASGAAASARRPPRVKRPKAGPPKKRVRASQRPAKR
jgi:uncharacterized Zn finger protein